MAIENFVSFPMLMATPQNDMVNTLKANYDGQASTEERGFNSVWHKLMSHLMNVSQCY